MRARSNFDSVDQPQRPLLESIQREIDDRIRAIADARCRRGSFASRAGADAAGVASDLSTHRRALRGIQKELSRLGIAFDPGRPSRIVSGVAAVA